MDWFKVEADIATNPKVEQISDGTYRVLTYLWAFSMRHETGGHIPPNVVRLIPRVTARRLAELERFGFLHPNGNGWELHDWADHQHDALIAQEKKRRDRQRKRAAYWAEKGVEVSAETSAPTSAETSAETAR